MRDVQALAPIQSARDPVSIAFIDDWIETGFRSDGSEWPYKRSFALRGMKEGESPTDYYINAPIIEAPKSIQALVRLYRAELVVAVPVRKAVYQIQSVQGASGVVQIHLDGKVEYINEPFLSEADPEICAARIFLELLSSDWRYRLMRCNQCRKLFAPKRKSRESYLRGWHCEHCRNIAAAKAATEDARGSKRKEWLSLAADAVLDFDRQPRRSTITRTPYIVMQMNERLPWQIRATKNWVTRNLAEFQAEADKKGSKRNAKG